MDAGTPYDAAVSAVTGGPADPMADVRSPGPLGVRDPGVVDHSYGVNIVVRRTDLDMGQTVNDVEGAQALATEARERWASLPTPGRCPAHRSHRQPCPT